MTSDDIIAFEEERRGALHEAASAAEEANTLLPEGSKEKPRKAGRKLLAAGLTLATAASLFFAGLSSSPGELAYKKETAAPVVITAPVDPSEDDEDGPDENSESEKLQKSRSLKGFFSEWLLRLPASLKWLLGFPLWAVGSLALLAARKLLKLSLRPLLAVLLKWLLLGLLLFGLLYLLLKLLFPDLKLRELLNARTLITLWGGAGAAALLSGALSRLWDSFASYEYLFDFAGGLLILFAAAAPIIRKRRKKQIEAA